MTQSVDIHPVVARWIACWNTGSVDDLPIAENFSHTSPFGTIETKQRYLEIVDKNKAEFLGNRLIVTRHIQQGNQVCVQFEQRNEITGLHMEVCEWYVIEDDLIQQIRSFYNVGNAEIKG